jgi:hypothetical protein
VFTKEVRTENVWFYNKTTAYTLNDKRNKIDKEAIYKDIIKQCIIDHKAGTREPIEASL